MPDLDRDTILRELAEAERERDRQREEVRGFQSMRWPEEAHRLQQQRNAALARADQLDAEVEHYAGRYRAAEEALAAAEARAETLARQVEAAKAQADQWEFGVPDAHIERAAVVEGLRAALDTATEEAAHE